jgi:hypothetical protein
VRRESLCDSPANRQDARTSAAFQINHLDPPPQFGGARLIEISGKPVCPDGAAQPVKSSQKIARKDGTFDPRLSRAEKELRSHGRGS